MRLKSVFRESSAEEIANAPYGIVGLGKYKGRVVPKEMYNYIAFRPLSRRDYIWLERLKDICKTQDKIVSVLFVEDDLFSYIDYIVIDKALENGYHRFLISEFYELSKAEEKLLEHYRTAHVVENYGNEQEDIESITKLLRSRYFFTKIDQHDNTLDLIIYVYNYFRHECNSDLFED